MFVEMKRWVGIGASVLVMSLGSGAVYAQAARKDAAPAAAQVAPAATTSSQPPINPALTAAVDGFRTAKFGMAEADVRSR